MRRRSGLSPAPIEFLPRRFYLVVVHERQTCSVHRTKMTERDASSERNLYPRTPGIHFVSLQEQLLASNEFVLGIPQTIRFNSFLTSILSGASTTSLATDPARHQSTGIGPEKVHYFFLRRRHLREEIQAIHLICRWRLLYLQLPPHEALAPFEHLPYLFSSFLSSSSSFDPPNLLVSLAGIAKGLEKELLGPLTGSGSSSNSESSWDDIAGQTEDESRFWTISHRFVVYSSQTATGNERKHPEDRQDNVSAELEETISALKRRRVSLVITLSSTQSDTPTFAARGLEALDISSSTGTSPTTSVTPSDGVLVNRFLEACEGTDGLIAVNASSSPGCVSAATCIGCYLMKHSNFTSQEAIGWLRFCLPVKIPMAWELFLDQMQAQMWLEGERFRRAREGDLPDSPTSDSTHINIGKISLGRLSLLGTRDRDRHRGDPHPASIPVSTCLSSRSQEPQQSPTAQLKRRRQSTVPSQHRRHQSNKQVARSCTSSCTKLQRAAQGSPKNINVRHNNPFRSH